MINLPKNVLISTILFFVVLLFATATIIRLKDEAYYRNSDVIVSDSPIVFYFGYNCPHCKIVEKYLVDNKVSEKVRFSMKEVYKNPANTEEAFAKAALCSIDKKNLGVPFLWDGEKCYRGDEEIINFFKAKMQEMPKTGTESSANDAETAVALAADAQEDKYTYYYSQDCPHCQVVKQFILDNKVEEKVPLFRKETSQNQSYHDEAMAKEEACSIAKENMTVPLLTIGDKCYMGEEQIINFFKEKLTVK
jgi:glutaredoxin